MMAEFYAYITRKGAVRTTRRPGAQVRGEVKIRLTVEIPNEAWDPVGTPTANIKVPLTALTRPPIEIEVEAMPDPLTPQIESVRFIDEHPFTGE